MKDKLASAKNYVVAHKTTIKTVALTVTAVVAVIEQVSLRQHDAFLKEHNLYDTYYADYES